MRTTRYFARKIMPIAAAVAVGSFVYLKITEPKPKLEKR